MTSPRFGFKATFSIDPLYLTAGDTVAERLGIPRKQVFREHMNLVREEVKRLREEGNA